MITFIPPGCGCPWSMALRQCCSPLRGLRAAAGPRGSQSLVIVTWGARIVAVYVRGRKTRTKAPWSAGGLTSG